MPIQLPQGKTLSLVALDGYLRSINIPIPDTSDTDYLFDTQYLPTNSPNTFRAYYPDLRSRHVVQNYNNACTGLAWEQIFETYGGVAPILYEIVQAPAGMTIGTKLIRDPITGYFVPDDDYSVLRWANPVAGQYRVAIRATDQLGAKVYWIWDLFVGATNHYFMALNATGNGSGSSQSNYASFANTFLGATTVSPCKGKVLHIKGDDYPSTTAINASTAYLSSSFVAMPNETPILRSKINVTSDNFSAHGITFQGVSTSEFGVVGSQQAVNNFALWKCKFDACINSDILGSNNQSCVAFNKSGNRETILVISTEFKNSTDLHGIDYYAIKDHKFSRNKLTITDSTTAITRSWIFPKQLVENSHIEYNVADIPTVTPSVAGVAQLYHSVVGGNPVSAPFLIDFRYNYIRVAGGVAVQINQDEGETSNAVNFDTYLTKNTIVGGRLQAAHWVSTGAPNRRIFMDSNIAVNSDSGAIYRDGGTMPAPNTTDWYFETGTNVKAASGTVDSNGHLIDTTNRGKAGHGIWRPE